MGSNPAWKDGYTPNAAEWNSWWAKKADEGGGGGGGFLPLTGGTLTGPVNGTSANFTDPSVIGGVHATLNANGDVFLGSGQLASGGTLFSSIGIGVNALRGNASTNANNNIAIGNNTLWSNLTTGSGIIAIGVNAGQFAVDQVSSVLIGTAAGQQLASGGRSIMLGEFTGSGLTNGSNNVLIGYQVASSVLATGSNDIYIGTGPAIDAATAGESGTLRIGGHATNTIRATGINTAASKLFLDWMPASTTFASDAAASSGGVAIGQLYRNGSVIQCRIA
jgi:hypothetical protein